MPQVRQHRRGTKIREGDLMTAQCKSCLQTIQFESWFKSRCPANAAGHSLTGQQVRKVYLQGKVGA